MTSAALHLRLVVRTWQVSGKGVRQRLITFGLETR